MKGPKISAGAQALRAEDLSSAALARKLGVGGTTVKKWLRGETIPGSTSRAKIRRAFGIDDSLWDHFGDAPAQKNKSASKPHAEVKCPEPPAPDAPELEHIKHSLWCIRHDVRTKDLSVTEVSKYRADEARLVGLVLKLEREAEMSEDRYVREHPAFVALIEKIYQALAKHPKALKDVRAAIEG